MKPNLGLAMQTSGMDADGRITFYDVPHETFQPAQADERDNSRGKSGEAAKAASQSPNKALPRSAEAYAAPADLSNGGRSPEPRFEHLTAGAERVPVVIRARELRRQTPKPTFRDIGDIAGVPWQTWRRWVLSVAHIVHDDHITAEHLATRTFKIPGRARALQLTAGETDAIRANKLLNNLNADAGSTPRAIFQTIKEGGLRPEVAAHFREREAAGKTLVTPALANDLHISPATTRSFRNGRNAWLNFIESPGSLQMTRDEITGEARPIEPGEFCTTDDGTKNFICTVPMQRPGDKCYENFGVVVGRWQFLLDVDHRTYFVKGFTHVARPKGSYRAEDLQANFHMSFQQHGLPKKVFLEKGISKAELLHQTLDRLDVKYEHVNSPHQKVVECVFNNLWSRLSFLPGQVGRVRGEESEIDVIVESCKRGATDPRGYFLPLNVVLEALREAIADWNNHRVQSAQYGSWVPAEWFAAAAPRSMRHLNPADAWIFAPVVTDPLLVRGSTLKTSFLVMPGYSWRFDYSAPWFTDYSGARFRLHFNPFEPEAVAKAVLAEDFHGERGGTVLGDAVQINWHTRHNRRLLGIDETEDIGLVRTRMNAQALHRSAIAIRPDGKPGVQTHESRNGLGDGSKAAVGLPEVAVAQPPRLSSQQIRSRGVSEDEFDRQAARLAREEQRERAKTLVVADD